MKPSTVRKRFFSVLSDTEDNISSFVHNPGVHMTRHRYCDFKDTVLATISLSMNRNNTELLNYFGVDSPHIPSKSAFTQQRKKFNSQLFPHLLDAFNDAIPAKKTFKGYHLVAVDGTDLNLPTDRHDDKYCVKQAHSDNYYYQMHVNAFYDICENRFIKVFTQPRPQMNENAALCQMISECSLPKKTIFIADRGYVSLNTIATLLHHNKYFLIRAKAPSSGGSLIKNLVQPDIESDAFYSIGVARSKYSFRGMCFDKTFRIGLRRKFDHIHISDKDTVVPMTIRVTCVKLDDSYEYLISNLPMSRFSKVALKELYWKRWSIETSFRRLKYALSLSYLHSVNRDLIIQEVYAKLILYNLASLIHSFGQDNIKTKETNKHHYRISFDDTVPIVRCMLKMLLDNDTIKALLLTHKTAVKVGTSSYRNVRSQTVNPLNNRA